MMDVEQSFNSSEVGGVTSEVSDLRKKYRVMEGSKKQYAEESKKILRQQKAIIDKIKVENEKLKAEIETQSRFAGAQKEITKTEDLFRYSEEVEKLYFKVEGEKKKQEELKEEEQRVTRALAKNRQKKKEVTRQAARARATSPVGMRKGAVSGKGVVETMENRLAKMSQKFNDVVSSNKRMRQEIDDLRKARVSAAEAFDKLLKQLDGKSDTSKKAMEEVKKNAEKRDEYLRHLEAVREESDRDQAEFIREYRRLGQILEGGPREGNLVGEHHGAMSKEEEEDLKKKLSKQRWKASKNSAYHSMLKERVQSFEEAFKRISEATGIEELDEFVDSFINEEDGSFHTIKHINMLEADIRRMEAEVSDTNDEIEKIRKEQSSSEESWKQRVQKQQEKLEKLNQKEVELQKMISDEEKQLQIIKNGILKLWNSLGCSKITEEMNPNEIRVDEVLNFLGVIEQRVSELLLLYSSVNNPTEGGPAVIGRGPLFADEAGHVSVVPPSIGNEDGSSLNDFNDDEEDEDMPIPLEKLKAKAVQGIQKNSAVKRDSSTMQPHKRRTSVSRK